MIYGLLCVGSLVGCYLFNRQKIRKVFELFMRSLVFTMLILFPFVSALVLSFLSNIPFKIFDIRVIRLKMSYFLLFASVMLWLVFDSRMSGFQFVVEIDWIFLWWFGVDGISLFLILLTTFLTVICLLTSWNQGNIRLLCQLLLILEGITLLALTTLDLFIFYVFFEAVLLPMFFIIGIWGSRTRKLRAAYQLVLYTLVGSLLMLFGIILLFFQVGSTDYHLLLRSPFSDRRDLVLWGFLFLAFAVKIPMIPLHIWLPEAHVEAPTAGSVILAGILLKLGGYGFLRISLPICPAGSIFFRPIVAILSLTAVVYASLTTFRQSDLKKIIAYSSVAHMGYVTLGIFSGNIQGLEGRIFLMLSHGFISSALFLRVGCLYDRHGRRLISYYGRGVRLTPLLASLMLIFILGNIGLPATSGFIGEALVLFGILQLSVLLGIGMGLGMILRGGYSLWLYRRIFFSQSSRLYWSHYADLRRREFHLFLWCAVPIMWLGIYPQIILEDLHARTSLF